MFNIDLKCVMSKSDKRVCIIYRRTHTQKHNGRTQRSVIFTPNEIHLYAHKPWISFRNCMWPNLVHVIDLLCSHKKGNFCHMYLRNWKHLRDFSMEYIRTERVKCNFHKNTKLMEKYSVERDYACVRKIQICQSTKAVRLFKLHPAYYAHCSPNWEPHCGADVIFGF